MKKVKERIAASKGVLERMDISAAAQTHIPNRPIISSNMGNLDVTYGTSTSFAVIPKTMPMINGNKRERLFGAFDILCSSGKFSVESFNVITLSQFFLFANSLYYDSGFTDALIIMQLGGIMQALGTEVK